LQLQKLRDYDRSLTADVDDWEILLALGRDPQVGGFITNEINIIEQSRELAVLSRVRLTLVITHRAGDDALRATGLLMTYLPEVATYVSPNPQLVVLSPNKVGNLFRSIGKEFERLATGRGMKPEDLLDYEWRQTGLKR
jgi:hypothetical protein